MTKAERESKAKEIFDEVVDRWGQLQVTSERFKQLIEAAMAAEAGEDYTITAGE